MSPPPMDQDRTMRYLAETLNYTLAEAVNAVNGAMATETSTYQLARHQVRWDYPGVYFVTEAPDPRLRDSAGRLLPREAGCCHEPAPGEYESRYPHLSSGHELSRAQIAKHGTDRYPTPGAQYAKVLDELGELGEALIEGQDSERVRAEYADAGLALYALGEKLGLDLIQVMRELVANDTRDFR